ncbi:MAG: hypothetical protein E7610_03575 [Ruminococcaceae bacterium]|nr:hypothetical protein [Oscillospiraceae bacterium]
MSNMPIKKHLMPSDQRELVPIAIPFLLGIMGVTVIVCLATAIQDQIGIAYVISVGLSILWGGFFRAALRTLRLRDAEYCYDSQKILNDCGKYKSDVDVSRVMYVCVLHIPFATGKGSIKIGYYVLSNTPIDASLIDEDANGMASVEAMIKSGLVVLPVENDTNCFIHSILCSQEIPAFPDFLVSNGTSFPSTHEHET